MRKTLWITGTVLILAISLAACGGQATPAPTAVPPTEAPAQVEPTAEPTSPPAEAEEPVAESETEAETEAEAEEESPAVIFARAMEGVQTDVQRFTDGFPMPESAAITIIEAHRVEFIWSGTVPDGIAWAKEAYAEVGLIEVPELGYESDNSASFWYGGYPTGEAIRIRIQRVTDSTTTFKINFEDL